MSLRSTSVAKNGEIDAIIGQVFGIFSEPKFLQPLRAQLHYGPWPLPWPNSPADFIAHLNGYGKVDRHSTDISIWARLAPVKCLTQPPTK
jgi:hypothetical protein